MYVCMYTYVLPVSHMSACSCMYVHVRIRICIPGFMCLACVGPELHALTYIHTMLLHIVLLLARQHRYSGTMSRHVRTYAHMFYFGLCVLHALGQP